MRVVSGPGLDLCVQAQPELLVESVLGNLLSNAIKFSPAGAQIRIQAEAFGPQVSILLSDPGPGLPPQVRERIGQEGALPSQLGTAGEQGQGFGLLLVQEHVQRMGGRVELNDREGGGTCASCGCRARSVQLLATGSGTTQAHERRQWSSWRRAVGCNARLAIAPLSLVPSWR